METPFEECQENNSSLDFCIALEITSSVISAELCNYALKAYCYTARQDRVDHTALISLSTSVSLTFTVSQMLSPALLSVSGLQDRMWGP